MELLHDDSQQAQNIRFARTCYDHLAGELGVNLTQKLLEQGILETGEHDYAITALGWQWLTEFGIDLSVVQKQRRVFARPCLDWSERRYHLSGGLGAAIANHLFENHLFELKWIVRIPDSRAVQLTQTGQNELEKWLDLKLIYSNC